jgi:hypothetical protein
MRLVITNNEGAIALLHHEWRNSGDNSTSPFRNTLSCVTHNGLNGRVRRSYGLKE